MPKHFGSYWDPLPATKVQSFLGCKTAAAARSTNEQFEYCVGRIPSLAETTWQIWTVMHEFSDFQILYHHNLHLRSVMDSVFPSSVTAFFLNTF